MPHANASRQCLALVSLPDTGVSYLALVIRGISRLLRRRCRSRAKKSTKRGNLHEELWLTKRSTHPTINNSSLLKGFQKNMAGNTILVKHASPQNVAYWLVRLMKAVRLKAR